MSFFWKIHDAVNMFLLRKRSVLHILLLVLAHSPWLVFLIPDHLQWQKDFGSLAFNLLLTLLFLSPLATIVALPLLRTLMLYRGEMGLVMGYTALIHMMLYMERLVEFGMFPPTELPLFIQVGFLALLCTIPLLITSNRFSQRTMGIWWKRLHRLVYPLVALACLHVAFIPLIRGRGINWQPLVLLALYSSLVVYAWGVKRGTWPQIRLPRGVAPSVVSTPTI